jgi:hypothetical protein
VSCQEYFLWVCCVHNFHISPIFWTRGEIKGFDSFFDEEVARASRPCITRKMRVPRSNCPVTDSAGTVRMQNLVSLLFAEYPLSIRRQAR